jgi:acetate---CoA ligase (ADP-forming)
MKEKNKQFEKFFNPRSIAIVGASKEKGKVGNSLVNNITKLGFRGDVYFVNPKRKKINGKICYPALKDIPGLVDLAVIAVPAKLVKEVILAGADKVKNFVVISAGFSETGAEGKAREDELSELARRKKLNILGPNCLGFVVPALNLNASFAGGMPESGNIALVSQSGALIVGMLDMGREESLKFSKIVSLGNKMQMDESLMLEYLENDPETKVAAMYLEGIKDGKRFLEAAKSFSHKKPLVILKAGRTAKAQKAIASHTGALAGSDDIFDAVMKKVNAIRANDLEEFFSVLEIVSKIEPPETERTVIVTNAGGPGVLATDAFSGKSIRLAGLNLPLREKLKKVLPSEASVENPIDILGDAQEDRYRDVLEILKSQKDISNIICLLTPQDQTPVEKIAKVISDFASKKSKKIVAIFLGGEKTRKSALALRSVGIPCFDFPEPAIQALDRYFQWKKDLLTSYSPFPLVENKERIMASRSIVDFALKEGRGALVFEECSKIMEQYSIPVIESISTLDSKKMINLKYPVVLKVDSDQMLHKTEQNGVILGIKNAGNLREKIFLMQEHFPQTNLIVQPMLPVDLELIVGMKKDPVFGPTIVCGMGGIYTEVLRMAEVLIPPLTKEEIKNCLRTGKLGFMFDRFRGKAPYDLEGLASIIDSISRLASEVEDIRELDINPLLIYNDGTPAVVVDVKIMIGK